MILTRKEWLDRDKQAALNAVLDFVQREKMREELIEDLHAYNRRIDEKNRKD